MKKIIFITRSISIDSIKHQDITTSSQAYELDLIGAVSASVTTAIVYVGVKEQGLARGGAISTLIGGSTVEYHHFGQLTPGNIFGLTALVRRIGEKSNCAIITTGYYPLELIALMRLGWLSRRSYSIVYDTHLLSTRAMNPVKRLFANIYFSFGFGLLRFLDGLIVINPEFIYHRRLRVPFLVTRIGADVCDRRVPANQLKPYRGPLKFLFAGTLNPDNGVALLLGYLQQNQDAEVEFWFYGYGELESIVTNFAAKDRRIKFGGVLKDAELSERVSHFDFALCLRNPDSLTAQYAFPSKLIRFMATDVPVISNKFPALDEEYRNHLLMMSSYSVSGIAEIIDKINAGTIEIPNLDERKNFLKTRHSWSEIAKEILNFVFSK